MDGYKEFLDFNSPEIQEAVYREFDIYMDSYGGSQQKLVFDRIKSDYSSMLTYWKSNPDPEGLALLCVSLSGLFSGSEISPEYNDFVAEFRSAFSESDKLISIATRLMSRRTDSSSEEEEESNCSSAWFSSEADFADEEDDADE